jgi:hypothetical protein
VPNAGRNLMTPALADLHCERRRLNSAQACAIAQAGVAPIAHHGDPTPPASQTDVSCHRGCPSRGLGSDFVLSSLPALMIPTALSGVVTWHATASDMTCHATSHLGLDGTHMIQVIIVE